MHYGGVGLADTPTSTNVGVAYRYVVRGETLDGYTPAFRATTVEGDEDEARALAEAHPPGTSVPVYYDPAAPARSTLEPPDPLRAGWPAIVAGAAAAVTGAIALLVR
jgi:hypothetical protein